MCISSQFAKCFNLFLPPRRTPYSTSQHSPQHFLLLPAATVSLLPEDFLYLSDFLLHLAGDLFRFTFGLKVGIVCQLSNLFLHFSLQVVQLALNFILYSWLHWLSP